MKIGILTQPLHKNYGGLLQNYALQQVLLKSGYDVETIDHQSSYEMSFRRFASRCLQWIKHITNPFRYKAPSYRIKPKEVAEIRKLTNQFINKYIRCSRQITKKTEFEDLLNENKYSALIVGSDQCWRPLYNRFLSVMYLDFAKNVNDIKRLSYAASFGSDIWEYSPQLTKQCSDLVKKFDLITVREESGIELCKKYLGVDAMHVLDPTMLLSKDDYINLISQNSESESEGTLFYYILDPSDRNKAFVEKVADFLSLKAFKVLPKKQAEIRTKDDIKYHIEDCVYPSVITWLRAFLDAKMVICDSFHGCVFSIIFNKPFWVIGNEGRGNTRFDSLLNTFGLQDRLISVSDTFDYDKKIDWDKVNSILEERRMISKSLLLEALK